jgi:glycosyltransferase involved in cell wall biosynthesis
MDMKNNRILLITRTFPPTVGGMEEFMYQLFMQMRRHHDVDLIALRKTSRKHLFWFIPYALFRALFEIHRKDISHVHIGDGLLAFLGPIIRYLSRADKISITVYGLDVIYSVEAYQRMIKWSLPQFDAVLAISDATKKECIDRGVNNHKCSVSLCGIDSDAIPADMQRQNTRRQLASQLDLEIDDRLLLLTVGRLVPRKGVYRFIKDVMARATADWHYIVIGDGPEKNRLLELCKEYRLEDRVSILGRLPKKTRDLAYGAADVFIMPNQHLAGDMEGFGLVAIEAGLFSLPVVATSIEGIKNAIISGVTGALVPPEQEPHCFMEAIEFASNLDRSAIRPAILENFTWQRVYERYKKALNW